MESDFVLKSHWIDNKNIIAAQFCSCFDDYLNMNKAICLFWCLIIISIISEYHIRFLESTNFPHSKLIAQPNRKQACNFSISQSLASGCDLNRWKFYLKKKLFDSEKRFSITLNNAFPILESRMRIDNAPMFRRSPCTRKKHTTIDPSHLAVSVDNSDCRKWIFSMCLSYTYSHVERVMSNIK